MALLKNEEKHIKKQTLDIRVTQNGRWYDQKVTPDVMSAICAAIHSLYENNNKISFTRSDLQDTKIFAEIMQGDFGKPHPKNPNARAEYDKVIGQPLNVLYFAGVIQETQKGKRHSGFMVAKKFASLLHRMSISEREASAFLNFYICETLSQSGLQNIFEEFFEDQDYNSYNKLLDKFQRFIKQHTKIKTNTEINRIFNKVLNIQSYHRGKKGSIHGHISKTIISLHDIRYNRVNFRDLASKKPKPIPRKQHRKSAKTVPDSTRFEKNVIRDVKEHHEEKTEIRDSHYNAENPTTVEGHHIFPKAMFKEFAAFRENIIILTPDQHRTHAHPKGGNRFISRSYQYFCLQRKLESIEKSHNDSNCIFYSFDLFKKMIGVTCKISEKILAKSNFDDVRRILAEHYVDE